jgi:DNA helicase IV
MELDVEYLKVEDARLKEVCAAVDAHEERRQKAIQEFNHEMQTYKQQLRETQGQKARLEIEQHVRTRVPFDPSKRMVRFEYPDVPYIAGIAIVDDNPKIGRQFYLLGKQGLSGEGSRQIIVDWRQAAISQLFYGYDEGDEYEETIGPLERTGVLEQKVKYLIRNRELLQVDRGDGSYRREAPKTKSEQPKWAAKGAQRTIDKKEQSGDFGMTDIIALISKDQFQHITSQHEGCFYLSGGAGSGKTTVALHRLSYLMFNHPDLFRPERCLVVMFNKALRNYVHGTSTELLTPRMPVETYNSWAELALRKLLGASIPFTVDPSRAKLSQLKKSAAMLAAIDEYLETGKLTGSPSIDLGLFYSNEAIVARHFGSTAVAKNLIEEGKAFASGRFRKLCYDDAGILLYLAQKTRGAGEVESASLWYDHIVIDEAQDLSLVELKTLHFAASKRKSMTVCADTKQRILDFVDDKCFEQFHADLKSQGMALGNLGVSYRSTRQIMELASRVSGKPVGEVRSEGPIPRVHVWASEQEALTRLRGSLQALVEQEPQSLTAVICRWKQDVLLLEKALRGVPGMRMEMTFKPGVIVTNVHQVKGLEYSNVIIWNPSQKNYPDTQLGRNLLYVAVTRASSRLAIFHHEPLTSILEMPTTGGSGAK